MSTFWNWWAIAATVVFFILMVSVIIKYWRSNHKADQDHTIASFDGIDEKTHRHPNYCLPVTRSPFCCQQDT